MVGSTQAINKVLSHEGGYVNHPADKGGRTNFGITQKVYEEFKGRPVTESEMMNMPIADARAIYKAGYWDKVGGDSIKSYAIAYTIFDQAVNRGTSSALIQAQRIVGLPATGVLNGQLITALNSFNEQTFIDQYLIASENFYKNLVANDPTQAVFLAGWLNRVTSLKNYATENFNKITSTISDNPWILIIPGLAMAGVVGYMVINKGSQNARKYA